MDVTYIYVCMCVCVYLCVCEKCSCLCVWIYVCAWNWMSEWVCERIYFIHIRYLHSPLDLLKCVIHSPECKYLAITVKRNANYYFFTHYSIKFYIFNLSYHKHTVDLMIFRKFFAIYLSLFPFAILLMFLITPHSYIHYKYVCDVYILRSLYFSLHIK